MNIYMNIYFKSIVLLNLQFKGSWREKVSTTIWSSTSVSNIASKSEMFHEQQTMIITNLFVCQQPVVVQRPQVYRQNLLVSSSPPETPELPSHPDLRHSSPSSPPSVSLHPQMMIPVEIRRKPALTLMREQKDTYAERTIDLCTGNNPCEFVYIYEILIWAETIMWEDRVRSDMRNTKLAQLCSRGVMVLVSNGSPNGSDHHDPLGVWTLEWAGHVRVIM